MQVNQKMQVNKKMSEVFTRSASLILIINENRTQWDLTKIIYLCNNGVVISANLIL